MRKNLDIWETKSIKRVADLIYSPLLHFLTILAIVTPGGGGVTPYILYGTDVPLE